jgi:hypothetical protein
LGCGDTSPLFEMRKLFLEWNIREFSFEKLIVESGRKPTHFRDSPRPVEINVTEKNL